MLLLELAVPPLVPPKLPSVARQRQYRRLWRQYRCCGSRAPPGARGTVSGTAASAAKANLCFSSAVVPPPMAAVPPLRDLLRAVGGLKPIGATVPPALAVVPPLRDSAPQRLDFQGTYLSGLLPQ